MRCIQSPISGSPFALQVHAGRVCARQCVLSPPAPLGELAGAAQQQPRAEAAVAAGVPFGARLSLRDLYGNRLDEPPAQGGEEGVASGPAVAEVEPRPGLGVVFDAGSRQIMVAPDRLSEADFGGEGEQGLHGRVRIEGGAAVAARGGRGVGG